MNLESITQEPTKTYDILKDIKVIYLDNKTQYVTLVGMDVTPLLEEETRTIQAYWKNSAYRSTKGGCPECEENRLRFLDHEYGKYLEKLRFKYFGGKL